MKKALNWIVVLSILLGGIIYCYKTFPKIRNILHPPLLSIYKNNASPYALILTVIGVTLFLLTLHVFDKQKELRRLNSPGGGIDFKNKIHLSAIAGAVMSIIGIVLVVAVIVTGFRQGYFSDPTLADHSKSNVDQSKNSDDLSGNTIDSTLVPPGASDKSTANVASNAQSLDDCIKTGHLLDSALEQITIRNKTIEELRTEKDKMSGTAPSDSKLVAFTDEVKKLNEQR
jgi:heme/copper-type cytochrome/quinol oxidase subunit 1